MRRPPGQCDPAGAPCALTPPAAPRLLLILDGRQLVQVRHLGEAQAEVRILQLDPGPRLHFPQHAHAALPIEKCVRLTICSWADPLSSRAWRLASRRSASLPRLS